MADGRQDNPGRARPRAAPSREERLRAALQANIARRKAQARAARGAADTAPDAPGPGAEPEGRAPHFPEDPPGAPPPGPGPDSEKD